MKRLLALTAFLTMSLFASAESLKVGDPAPQVTATTETGAELAFSEAYSKTPYTLVFFYPKAFTGGCTAQSCALRDGYEALAKQGVSIIGVSTDSVETQKKFKDEYRLPYTLIADTDKKVLKAFGQTALLFASRQAYLIKDNKIVYADLKGSTKQQAEDILKFLAAK
ncbi:peroxiredoxin [Rariglobus hedericola]|uniref:thioredoxin-dependent peroxiredoxin n=1 Tax=Rariglobus hedericola TaxID=2597822 RepID=A0A556QJA6_9BACT|nr:peroxiredoxin [Rariglobus hedericola]TSJ76734.1 peroxiredoxin [Rariglobus hedericola]